MKQLNSLQNPEGFQAFNLFREDLNRAAKEEFQCEKMPTDVERIWKNSPDAIKEYYSRKATGCEPKPKHMEPHEDIPDCLSQGEQGGCIKYRHCEWWADCVVGVYVSALAAGWLWHITES